LTEFHETRLHTAHHLFESTPPYGPIQELIDHIVSGAGKDCFEATARALMRHPFERPIVPEIEGAIGHHLAQTFQKQGRFFELFKALTPSERAMLVTSMKEAIWRHTGKQCAFGN
jgi:hypothetical protein